jgi:hypothetical protein
MSAPSTSDAATMTCGVSVLNYLQRLTRLFNRHHVVAIFLQNVLHGSTDAPIGFNDQHAHVARECRRNVPEQQRLFGLAGKELQGDLVAMH